MNNTEFVWTDDLVHELMQNNAICDYNTLSKRIEQFKKSKQPKPEWEILAYQHKNTKEIAPKGTIGFAKVMYDAEYQIFQVNRLSDGEVFTIGDKYKNESSNKEYTIREFEIRDGELRANATEHGFDYFCDLIKVKEILFTTEDGKSMHVGDICFTVRRNILNIVSSFICQAGGEMTKEDMRTSPWVYFSSNEAAESYILMNKPLFSMQDFVNMGYTATPQLINAAKEKLNK